MFLENHRVCIDNHKNLYISTHLNTIFVSTLSFYVNIICLYLSLSLDLNVSSTSNIEIM